VKKELGGAILCVGNFDSGTGYAWKLIEKLWTIVAMVGDKMELETIVCYPSISEINPVLDEAGISVRKQNITSGEWCGFFKSLKFIRSNRIKYLYLTDRPALSWCYLLYRILGVKKIIIHDHTPGYRVPVVGIRRVIKKIRNRIKWVTADNVIGVSPYVCQRLELVNCIPLNKIQCVTNGITDSLKIKDYGLDSPQLVRIVTVARVNYYKGIDFAIKVMQLLVDECDLTCLQYDVIGDGPELETFKELAKALGVERNINFLGMKSNVEDLLPNYDIAFHPSKGEAMCLAIVEYMRASLPVVVSSNPSVNSILKENEDCLFYEEANIQAAVAKIKSLVHASAERERLGTIARVRYEENYKAELMEQHFKSCISSCLAGPKQDESISIY